MSNLTEYQALCPDCGEEILYQQTIKEWLYCSVDKDGDLADTQEVVSSSLIDNSFYCDNCEKIVGEVKTGEIR